MQKVFLRADAGAAIGYGHFVRSLALAAMLKDDFDCILFTSTPSNIDGGVSPTPSDFQESDATHLASFLSNGSVIPSQLSDFQRREAEGVCRLAELPSDDSRFGIFLELLKGDEIVVLDNYFFNEDYVRAIQSHGCKVVRIQDFFGEKSLADAMIFPCRSPRNALLRPPFLSDSRYPHLFSEGSTQNTHFPHFFGEGSAENATSLTEKVRVNQSEPVYPQQSAEGKGREGRWVVTFGGSDPLGLTERYVRELHERGLEPLTLSGGQGADEVAELFRSAEGVICSASSVCYEALACGCKVCAGWYIDNQKDFFNLLTDRRLILPLGDLRPSPSSTDIPAKDCAAAPLSSGACPVALPQDLSVAPASPEIAANFRQAPQYYRTLFHSLELEMVNYTDLTPGQSREVWQLRNADDIRRWMTNPEPFDFDSHSHFIETLKSRPDREYYAFFKDGRLVGSYDFTNIKKGSNPCLSASDNATNKGGGSADSGLFVNPAAQGQGIAKQMAARMDTIAYRHGISTLRAVVLESNDRSLRFHQSIGYEIISHKDGVYNLAKEL